MSGNRSPDVAARRRQIEARLRRFGLDSPPADLDGDALRRVLEGLGPVFGALGSYLSSRPDLLSGEVRHALGRLRPRRPPTPPEDVEKLLERSLGAPAVTVFERFEARPRAVDHLQQTHAARLHGGSDVVVQLAKPEAVEAFEIDGELLELLGAPLGGGRPAMAALEDFSDEAARSLDLAGAAEDLDGLRRGAARSTLLQVPHVHAELSGRDVLVRDAVPGEWSAIPPEDADRPRAAQRLCLVWLFLVLRGDRFPLHPDELVLLRGGRQVAVRGGAGHLSLTMRRTLRRYLQAAAEDDVDTASTSLASAMAHLPAGGESELRAALHRAESSLVVPEEGLGEGLLSRLISQWRIAHLAGCAPTSELASFYRGLYGVATRAQRLARDGDPLRSAVDELRVKVLADELTELFHRDGFATAVSDNLQALVSLPVQLDRFLDAQGGAEASQNPRNRRRASSEPAPSDRRAVFLALLATLVTVAGSSHLLSAAGLGGNLLQPMAATLLLAAGILAVYTA